MGKIIRPTYPIEFSIGLLLLIFVLSSFLSSQIFSASWRDLLDGSNVLFGMFLVGVAVIIMVLILWEDFLFPLKINLDQDAVTFRNHRAKLKTQALAYCAIPAIFIFIYFNYEINTIRYVIWATICCAAPIAIKLISGIKNYNDFLKLSNDTISYKNNEKEGKIPLKNVQHIMPIRDENNTLHKVHLLMNNNETIVIDLDEMELEAFFDSIDKFVSVHYKSLLKS
jgi:hypothetical protein